MPNVYNRAKFRLVSGDLDFDTATLRCLLVTASYTYSPDHNTLADITGELTVGGYARQTLGGVAVSEDDTNDRGEVQANQATFAALATGETVHAAVIFQRLTDSDLSTDPLVAFFDLTNTPTNGGDILVRFNSASPGALLRLNES